MNLNRTIHNALLSFCEGMNVLKLAAAVSILLWVPLNGIYLKVYEVYKVAVKNCDDLASEVGC